MRPLKSTAALLATGAAVLSAPLTAAPVAKPRLLLSPPAQAGLAWTGMLADSSQPSIIARLRSARQPVPVRRVRPGRYRLRAAFSTPGRWTLMSGRYRLGSVLAVQLLFG